MIVPSVFVEQNCLLQYAIIVAVVVTAAIIIKEEDLVGYEESKIAATIISIAIDDLIQY